MILKLRNLLRVRAWTKGCPCCPTTSSRQISWRVDSRPIFVAGSGAPRDRAVDVRGATRELDVADTLGSLGRRGTLDKRDADHWPRGPAPCSCAPRPEHARHEAFPQADRFDDLAIARVFILAASHEVLAGELRQVPERRIRVLVTDRERDHERFALIVHVAN